MNKETVGFIKQWLLKVNADLILFFLFDGTVALDDAALRIFYKEDDFIAFFGGR